VCKAAGIILGQKPFLKGKEKREYECPICYDDFDGVGMYALPCAHFFCKDCWTRYLTTQIGYGPSCLLTYCPYLGCHNVVAEEIVMEIGTETDQKLYSRYLTRSFVDDNPKIKWCPAPNCGKAVYCEEAAGVVDNVVCECGESFCFKCQREAHEPCSCDELGKWKVKEKDESETANWLMVHTKICPKCKKPMEKNGGCNHMTCSQCKHEFCWICMDAWSEHGSSTGGFYKCNKYKPDELEKKTNQGAIDSARAALEKYTHYFKRYANHLNSEKFEKQLKEKSQEKMKKLQIIHRYSSWNDVEYILKAIEQLCACRKALKYTYIYAYYLTHKTVKELFEFLQEDLERETERLSGLLEADVEKFNRDQILSSTKSAQVRLHHLLLGVKEGLGVERNAIKKVENPKRSK